MKHHLLSLLLSAGAIAASASTPDCGLSAVNGCDLVKEHNVKAGAAVKGRQLAPGVFQAESNGMKKLHVSLENASARLSVPKKITTRAAAGESFSLFESFEAWNGTDKEWTPEGWSVDMRGEVERGESWTASAANANLPAPADGNKFFGINYSADSYQDEWLISPFAEVKEGMILSFYAYYSPAYLFDLNNIDWDSPNYDFIEQVVTATLQVWTQVEGEEWTMLHDFADDYKGMSYLDLSYLEPTSMEKKSFSIEQFNGKKIRVAFRYVGQDGNTMFVDAISIGYPALENVSYMEPLSTLYWGFDGSENFTSLTAAVAMQPVFEPITWTNMTNETGVTYEWTYSEPGTAQTVTSDEQEELTVTYLPDYDTENRMRNNFYLPPTLTATAPGATPSSYTSSYALLQAGGKAESVLNDGSTPEFDLMPYAPQTNLNIYNTIDDPQIGDLALPVFGYNVNTDRYWLNYSLNGAEANEGDFSHLEGIANLIMPSGAPLVVHGVNVYGYGKIGADVPLTATIYAMSADMTRDIEDMEVVATATIKGSQVQNQGTTTRGYLAMNFNFETPAVIKATEEHPAYLVMFTGFRSKDVDYFAPIQSFVPDPNGICLGFLHFNIDLSSHTGRPAYWNLKPMVYKEYGEYVDLYNAFAIGLDAEYPWLTTECEGVTFSTGNRKAQVELGSYYDGSRLTVEAPEGVKAEVAGRYNACVLTVEHSDLTADIDGTINVKGPGVELSIPVKGSASAGIADAVAGSERTVSGIYDLSGRRVDTTDASGVYIVRYTDGSSAKTIVK